MTCGIYFPENTMGSAVALSRALPLPQVALFVNVVSSAYVFDTLLLAVIAQKVGRVFSLFVFYWNVDHILYWRGNSLKFICHAAPCDQ